MWKVERWELTSIRLIVDHAALNQRSLAVHQLFFEGKPWKLPETTARKLSLVSDFLLVPSCL